MICIPFSLVSTATGVRSKGKSSAISKESTAQPSQLQSQVQPPVASASAVQASTANSVHGTDEVSAPTTMSVYQLQASFSYIYK